MLLIFLNIYIYLFNISLLFSIYEIFAAAKLCKQLFYLSYFLKTTNNFIPFQINFEFMQGSNLIFQVDINA